MRNTVCPALIVMRSMRQFYHRVYGQSTRVRDTEWFPYATLGKLLGVSVDNGVRGVSPQAVLALSQRSSGLPISQATGNSLHAEALR